MDDLNAVEKYLYCTVNTPDNFTKAEKANLRRQCRNNFQLLESCHGELDGTTMAN